LLRLRRLSFFVRKTSRNQLQGMLCLTHVFELITERNDSMSITPVWDAATVEQAVAQVAAIRPAYASILGFYGPVFAAQAGAAAHTCPAAIQVDESALEDENGRRLLTHRAGGLHDRPPGGGYAAGEDLQDCGVVR
jgi:hypothetical protein